MVKEVDFIFDRSGNAQYRVLPRGRISDFSGNSIAFIEYRIVQPAIFDYQGNHKAWYDKGIVRDDNGDVLGFVENHQGKIFPFPRRLNKPNRSVFDKSEPNRPYIKSLLKNRPMGSSVWSNKSLKQALEDKI